MPVENLSAGFVTLYQLQGCHFCIGAANVVVGEELKDEDGRKEESLVGFI